MRFTVLPLSLSFLVGCGLEGSASDDTGAPASGSNGYSWGSAGNGDSDDEETDTQPTDDTDEPTDDTGTDPADDTGAEISTVTAKVWIRPETTWDVSVVGYEWPDFDLWPVANVTADDWTGYGTVTVDTTYMNEYVYDTVTYTPGDVLSVNGAWHDGVNPRYYAEAHGVVNALDLRVVIEFADGKWQGYSITGAEPDSSGEAGWTSNGGTGGDVRIQTYEDTLDHHDRSEMK